MHARYRDVFDRSEAALRLRLGMADGGRQRPTRATRRFDSSKLVAEMRETKDKTKEDKPEDGASPVALPGRGPQRILRRSSTACKPAGWTAVSNSPW